MNEFIAVNEVLEEALRELGKKSMVGSIGKVVLEEVVGLDVSDKWTELCFVTLLGGEEVRRERVRSTPQAFASFFGKLGPRPTDEATVSSGTWTGDPGISMA